MPDPYAIQRAKELRSDAAAYEGTVRTVTVELSLTSAWLLRDLIGIGRIGDLLGAPLHSDMLALNDVLGGDRSRPECAELTAWTLRHAERLAKGYNR